MPRFRKLSPENGFSHIFVLVAIFVLIGVVVFSNGQAIKKSSLGAAQNVLGENESKVDEQAQEAQKHQVEQQQEAQQKTTEHQKEVSKTEIRSGSPSTRINIHSKGLKKETEIETAEGIKIKTKVEDDGSIKVEVEKGKLKLKYSTQNGKSQLEAEGEHGQEVHLKTDELSDIKEGLDDELEKEGIKISTASGRMVIAKHEVAAQTSFPLSIDAATNQLTVTTPSGQKIVAILPDQAVNSLLTTGILNKIASQSAGLALTTDIGNLSNVVSLESMNNDLVYKVLGDKDYKLFGLLPVSTSATAFVSAQTGHLVAEERPLISELIKLLSIK